MIPVMREIILVAVLAIATMLTRFLPFFVFPPGKEIPDCVRYLGRTLPYAAMGLLVVYCLRDIHITAAPYGIPKLLAAALAGAVHWWKGNPLLSIGIGTICYMILIQVVFV